MTQGELEKIPDQIVKAMNGLEIEIMEDMVRRIRINGFSTASADWQYTRLQQLGMSEQQIKTWVKELLEATDQEVDRIYSDDVYEEYMGHARAYDVYGKDHIPFEENQQLQQLIQGVKQQTKDELQNITGSMGFVREMPSGKLQAVPLSDFYTQTLDAAAYDIQSGAFDYTTVLNRTINDMTKSGLRWIDYASGHHNRVPVAARRAVMTGFRQVQGQINEQVAQELHTDAYEVTVHIGARPSHQVWEGKVWTKEELHSVCGLGTVTGLHGANCYHDYNAFIPGVSVRTYSDDDLERIHAEENTPKTYMGREYTTYEALQRQRLLETRARKYREDIHLLEQGEGSEEDILAKKARYQQTLREYRKFSKKMDLPMQKERIYQDGLKVDVRERDLSKVAAAKPKVAEVKPLRAETPPAPAFTPAKTIEEAQEYAKSLGVKYAEYNKLPLETANIMNQAIETLPPEARPVFVGDSATLEAYRGVRLPRKGADFYGVTIDAPPEGLLLGRDPVSGRMARDFDAQGAMVGISDKYKTPEKIEAAKKKSQAAYMAKHGGKKWYFNEKGEATLYHEMGHAYQAKYGIPDGFERDALRWLQESGCDMLKTPSEAFSEAWGAYHTGNPDLPDYIAKYIEKASNTSGAKIASGVARYDEDVIIKHIKEDLIPSQKTDVLVPRQAIHRQGTKMFSERANSLAAKGEFGPGYITVSDDEILELVNKYKGSGEVRYDDKGEWNRQEVILDNDKVVGVVVNNRNGKSVETSVFKIHYADDGIHIAPDYPSKKKRRTK